MPALTIPALAAAALLALAGAQKLLDPALTVGALRALGLPSASWLVRIGSAGELALGITAVAAGGALLWWGVVLSYLLFAAFVVAALRRGTMIGSCGCFGRDETPPHWTHVALNVGLAGIATAMAVRSPDAPLTVMADRGIESLPALLLAALAVGLLLAAFVELPRTLRAGSVAVAVSGRPR